MARMGLGSGNAGIASTMAFATLTLARLFHGFNCRSRHNIFKLGFSSNWYSLGAFAAGVCLLGLVMFVPFLQKLFSVIFSFLAIFQVLQWAFQIGRASCRERV